MAASEMLRLKRFEMVMNLGHATITSHSKCGYERARSSPNLVSSNCKIAFIGVLWGKWHLSNWANAAG